MVKHSESLPLFFSLQVKKAVGGQSRGMALYEDDVRTALIFLPLIIVVSDLWLHIKWFGPKIAALVRLKKRKGWVSWVSAENDWSASCFLINTVDMQFMLLTSIDPARTVAAVFRPSFLSRFLLRRWLIPGNPCFFVQVWGEEDKTRAPNLAYDTASIILPSGAADATRSQFPLHPTTWANTVVKEREKKNANQFGNNFSSLLRVFVLCRAPVSWKLSTN